MQANPDLLGRPVLWIVVLGLFSLLPFAFMALTSFVKISTVLQIVRGAIGAQNVPSNTVIMALAAALTCVAMSPLATRIGERALPVLAQAERVEAVVLIRDGLAAVGEPLREFLSQNASPRDTKRFFDLARRARPAAERDRVAPTDLVVVIPAFVTSELLRAFSLGFALYIPFLIIDLVVSNVLLALGMQMMSPTQVSLPFKLLLFVAIDGWGLLAEALLSGYRFG